MEGPSMRRFPRIALHKPVELLGGETVIRWENPQGNLSVGGLFVTSTGPVPSGEVRLRIAGARPFELQGTVRHVASGGRSGVGIEFGVLPEESRRELEQLIAELTREGAPAA